MSNNTEHGGGRMNAGRMCAILTRLSAAIPRATAIALPGSAVLIAAMAGSPTLGQCKYELTRLAVQDCPFGSTEHPFALSESGIPVGDAMECGSGTPHAVIWEVPDVMTEIEFPWEVFESSAYDINSQGVIVGWQSEQYGGGKRSAFRYDGVEFLKLATSEGGFFSEAYAINDAGIIVGYAGNTWTGDPPTQPFIWRDSEMILLLDDFGGTYNYGLAYDVDEQGRVVGFIRRSLFDGEAFIWHDGEVTELGPVPGGYTAEARAINERCDVVGDGRVEDDTGDLWSAHPFHWSGGEMVELVMLPGDIEATAFDVNDMVQIVGTCSEGGPVSRSAVLWQHGQIWDLNALIEPYQYAMYVATSINNHGQIAGYFIGGNGFLLTPLDRPTGDADCDCKVGVVDLLFLLGEWGRTDFPADLDGDGVVDVTDLLMVLGDWGVSTAVESAER